MDYPGLRKPIFLILIALFLLILAWSQEKWTDWIRVFLALSGLTFLIAALLYLGDVVSAWGNARYMETQRASQMTERVKLVEGLSKLNPAQLQALEHYTTLVDVISGDAGPLFILRLPMGQEAPMTFVRDFVRGSGDEYLMPIRSFGEGTKEREWAQNLTGWMHYQGYVEPAAGNRPARWISKERCMRSLGLIDSTWAEN